MDTDDDNFQHMQNRFP